MLKSEYKNIFENQDTHWWYKGMGLINNSFLKQYLPKKKKIRILDVGCGTGAAFNYLSKYGEIIGIDISDDALKYAKKKGNVKIGSITAIPFGDSSFDLVVCLDVLYHLYVKNYREAISEMHRVLKKEGILLLREPAFDWLKSSHDVVDYTARRFVAKEIKNELERKSFKILKLTYVNFLLFPLVFLKRLPEILFLKKKGAKSDIFPSPKVINYLLLNLLGLERSLLKVFNFPFGSSVICVAKKI